VGPIHHGLYGPGVGGEVESLIAIKEENCVVGRANHVVRQPFSEMREPFARGNQPRVVGIGITYGKEPLAVQIDPNAAARVYRQGDWEMVQVGEHRARCGGFGVEIQDLVSSGDKNMPG
jgi:hypothetical protein